MPNGSVNIPQIYVPRPTPRKSIAQRGLSTAGAILDFINRPGYGVLNVLEDFTRTGKLTPVQSFLAGVGGEEKPSGVDVFRNLGVQPESLGGKIALGTAGLGLAVATDPLSYVGLGGLTKLGKTRQTVAGLQKLVSRGKALYQAGQFVAKAEDVGKPLLKTINEVNSVLKKLPANQVASLLSNSSKLMTPYEEALQGYRAIMRVTPDVIPFTSKRLTGGVPLVKGAYLYKRGERLGEMVRKSPVVSSLVNKFRKAEKARPDIAYQRRLTEIETGAFRHEAMQKSKAFADGLIKSKLNTDDVHKIASFYEFIDKDLYDKTGKLVLRNKEGMRKVFGVDKVPDHLIPHIKRFNDFMNTLRSAQTKYGLQVRGTYDFYKDQLKKLQSPEFRNLTMVKELRKRKEIIRILQKDISIPIKIGRLLDAEHEVSFLKGQSKINVTDDFLEIIADRKKFVKWYVNRKRDIWESKRAIVVGQAKKVKRKLKRREFVSLKSSDGVDVRVDIPITREGRADLS